jgi:hypothetical protein
MPVVFTFTESIIDFNLGLPAGYFSLDYRGKRIPANFSPSKAGN